MAPVFPAVAIILAFVDSASSFGFIIWSTFVGCALIATTSTGAQVSILLAGAAGLTLITYANAPWIDVIAILPPRLIHVSLFTLIFMMLGALRSRSAFHGTLVAVYIAAILLIIELLAFPLNALAARQLGEALWRRAQRKRPARAAARR